MSAQATRPHLDWAPVIPPTWDVVRLRWVARIFAGGTPDRSNLDFWTDGTIPWLNSGSVNDVVVRSPSAYITQAAVARGATRWAPAGSVLVALAGQGKTKGMAARLEISSTLNQSMAAIVPDKTVDYRYLQYWLASNYLNLRGLTGGDLRDGLNLQHIGSVQMPRPKIVQQRAIADFLDRETAQIDAFIVKNEELIALLTERRDSAWNALFDEVSAHTRQAPLRRFVDSISDGPFGSSLTSSHYSDDGTRVVRLGNLGINEFKDHDRVYIPNDYAASLQSHAARAGDVIVAGLGDDRMPLGRACVLPDIGPAIVKADCYRVRPLGSVSSEYLAWVLSAPRTRGQMMLSARGSTRARLNTSVVLGVSVPVPSPAVQLSVTTRFQDVAKTSDAAVGAARRAIELARERRAALISAAVTGKIDVGVDA